jgi:hypothetical protein
MTNLIQPSASNARAAVSHDDHSDGHAPQGLRPADGHAHHPYASRRARLASPASVSVPPPGDHDSNRGSRDWAFRAADRRIRRPGWNGTPSPRASASTDPLGADNEMSSAPRSNAARTQGGRPSRRRRRLPDNAGLRCRHIWQLSTSGGEFITTGLMRWIPFTCGRLTAVSTAVDHDPPISFDLPHVRRATRPGFGRSTASER